MIMYIIAGVIFLFSIFACISLMKGFNYRRKQAIEHYEKVRDKLTLPKEDIANITNESISSSANLIGADITLVVGILVACVMLSVIGTINDEYCNTSTVNSTLSNNAVTYMCDTSKFLPAILTITLGMLGIIISTVGKSEDR